MNEYCRERMARMTNLGMITSNYGILETKLREKENSGLKEYVSSLCEVCDSNFSCSSLLNELDLYLREDRVRRS